MGFLAPLGLATLGLGGLIVALHMLRVRRQERRVPSTLLWRSLHQDPPASLPWQPPRASLLLLLQLLALLALGLALARPFLPSGEIGGEHVIVLLDRSVSMAAGDLEPSRLEAAKARVLEIAELAGDAPLTVLAAADRPQIVAAAETDRAALRRALEPVGPAATPGELGEALDFAVALAEGHRDAQIVILSDGRADWGEGLRTALPIRFELFGKSDENQGITALSLGAAGPEDQARLFLQAGNGAGRPARREVEVLVDGALYDARTLALPAGGEAAFELGLPAGIEQVEARLLGQDALALDDRAWALRPRDEGLRVAVFGEANRFLDTALGLLPATGSVTRVGPERVDEPLGITDVAVLDGLVPATLPPGQLLLIAPRVDVAPDDAGAIRYAGELAEPRSSLAEAADPLVRDLGLEDSAILSAAALELGPAWTPLLEAEAEGRRWPLLARGSLGGRPSLLLAFDLRDSDLPLRPAFPLLMARAIDELHAGTPAGVPTRVGLDEAWSMPLPAGSDGALWIAPDGRERALEVQDGRLRFPGSAEAGIHAIRFQGQERASSVRFVVSGGSAAPLRIAPVPEPRLYATEDGGPIEGEPGAERSPGRRELWRPLALLALVALSLEWAWDHRRALRPRDLRTWEV